MSHVRRILCFNSEVDPIKEWDECLTKRFVLSKSFNQQNLHYNEKYNPNEQQLKRRRRIMLSIIFFELFKTVHYFCMLFVPLDSSNRLRAFTGSIYHCMGFGGKVLAIPSVCACLQAAITRLLEEGIQWKNRLKIWIRVSQRLCKLQIKSTAVEEEETESE